MKDLVIILLTLLGFVFPASFISAIRSNDNKKVSKYKMTACICFAAIIFLMSALINS